MLRNALKLCYTLCMGLTLSAAGHADEFNSISSTGGQFFNHRVEIAVPAFAQDDPRWSDVRLGTSTDTLGDEGCAVTSAAMVAAFYGIKTDPQQLNALLTRKGGLDSEGLIDWNQVPTVAPDRMELTYNGVASYDLIDKSLLAGNPVIVLIPLRGGAYHFVVIVGKDGQNYLIRDPAAGGSHVSLTKSDPSNWRVVHLSLHSSRGNKLNFHTRQFRVCSISDDPLELYAYSVAIAVEWIK